MQNQRQNGRPDAAVRMAGLFLVLFCVAAVLIPAKTLFTGNGFFADYIHFTESKRMYVEIAILAVLIFGGLALLKRGRSRMYWLTAGCAGVFLDSCGISADGGVGGVSD